MQDFLYFRESEVKIASVLSNSFPDISRSHIIRVTFMPPEQLERNLVNILCVSDFWLLTQPGLVLNLVSRVLIYRFFAFLFSLIELQAGIDEGSAA